MLHEECFFFFKTMSGFFTVLVMKHVVYLFMYDCIFTTRSTKAGYPRSTEGVKAMQVEVSAMRQKGA